MPEVFLSPVVTELLRDPNTTDEMLHDAIAAEGDAVSTIYVVRGTSGSYSDKTDWAVKAFLLKQHAERYCEFLLMLVGSFGLLQSWPKHWGRRPKVTQRWRVDIASACRPKLKEKHPEEYAALRLPSFEDLNDIWSIDIAPIRQHDPSFQHVYDGVDYYVEEIKLEVL